MATDLESCPMLGGALGADGRGFGGRGGLHHGAWGAEAGAKGGPSATAWP